MKPDEASLARAMVSGEKALDAIQRLGIPERRAWAECGVSVRTAWLTDAGRAALKAVP